MFLTTVKKVEPMIIRALYYLDTLAIFDSLEEMSEFEQVLAGSGVSYFKQITVE